MSTHAEKVAVEPFQAALAQNRSRIQKVTLNVSSQDSQTMASRVRVLAERRGGYAEWLRATQDSAGIHYEMTLRVPVDRLEEIVEEIKSLASQVSYETRSTHDATAEVVDLDARTRALLLTEKQLEELLSESRSEKRDAESILAIFNQLTSIREQREGLQGKLATISQLVALSEIVLSIEPLGSSLQFGQQWGFAGSVRNAAQLLISVLGGLAHAAIYLVIVGIPLLALGFAVSLAVHRIRRLLRSKENLIQP